jgi:hypothetical protein
VSPEAVLIAAAAVLYFADCIVLLERGQALWAKGALVFGSLHYQFRGKTVALLNPLTPFVAVSRTLPLFAAGFGMDPAAVRALAPVGALAALQFVLVFAALPWCLLRAPGMPFVAVLLFAYLNAILMLALTAQRFGRVGIARRPLLALGFGWLACLPLSVNCARKAGLTFEIAMDAREALRDLPAAARAQAAAALAAQAAEAAQELEEDDERHRDLMALKRQLEAGDGRA